MKKTLLVMTVLIVSLSCVFAAESTWSKHNVSFSYAPWVYKDVNFETKKSYDYNSKYGFGFGAAYEYKFLQYVGAEVAVDFTDVKMITKDMDEHGTYTQGLSYVLKAVGHLPVSSNFNIFAKLGIGGNTNFASFDSKKINSTFLFGVADLGAVYSINKNWGIGASFNFGLENKQITNMFYEQDTTQAWYVGSKITCAYAF